MKLSSKSKKRLKLLDVIKEGITSHEIFETIDYKNQSEDKIKQFIYPNLLNSLSNWIVKSKDLNLVLHVKVLRPWSNGRVTSKQLLKTYSLWVLLIDQT